ncbi:MAG: 30S ribosomal protein S6 [Oscillospiraceae bacterium]|nr:30S ribosomal protein S6 [Oscillospiraceae bacterium]
MAKNSYETIFIIDSTLEPDAIAAEKDKFVKIITDNAEIGEVEDWGKRRLAYPINFKSEGYYVLVNFVADTEFPKELDRRYRIDENILRTIIIRKDED